MNRKLLVAAGITAAMCVSNAWAIKPWTLVEDGYPERVHAIELEQTFSAGWQVKGDPGATSFGHELELETGLKEDFTLRVAGAYAYDHSADGDSTHFDGGKLEGQYYFTNPVIDPVGYSVIGAVTIGENSMEAEGIFVVQADLDKWTLGFNLGAATAVTGVFDSNKDNETEGTISASFGAIYDLTPTLRAGGEISAEAIFPDWSNCEKVNVYAGPCVSWVPTDSLWITAGVSYNVSGHDDEPRVIGSIIVGYYFN